MVQVEVYNLYIGPVIGVFHKEPLILTQWSKTQPFALYLQGGALIDQSIWYNKTTKSDSAFE